MSRTTECLRRLRDQVLTLRSGFVIIVSALALASLLVVMAVWFRNWHLDLPRKTDKITRINTVLATSAYALAFIGVVAAVVAYLQASGRPYLRAEIRFRDRGIESFQFAASEIPTEAQMPSWLDTNSDPFGTAGARSDPLIIGKPRGEGELLGEVVLHNDSSYAARNPGLRIEFDGLLCQSLMSGWQPALYWASSNLNGYRAIQWDGGTENIVHGQWSRALPQLVFNEVVVYRLSPPPRLVVTVVSDGTKPQRHEIQLNVIAESPPKPR